MVPSLFIHLGTVKEYIDHLTIYLPDFGFKNFVSSEIVGKNQEKNEKNNKIHDKSCIMYSLIGDSVCEFSKKFHSMRKKK